MQSIAAHDAKARFYNLLDTARREPVTIEKHGRSVAVVMSKEEFDGIEAMKLEYLRSEIQKGSDAGDAGDVVEVDDRDLEQFVERVMVGGELSALLQRPPDQPGPPDRPRSAPSGATPGPAGSTPAPLARHVAGRH